MDGGAWWAAVHGVARVEEQLVGTKELILESDVKISDKKHQIIAALV